MSHDQLCVICKRRKSGKFLFIDLPNKEIEVDYDFQGNILEQLFAHGKPFTFYFDKNTSITYSTYAEFLKDWEDDTGIPCWTCGRELFRLRGTDELLCMEMGKVLGNV